MCSKNREKLRVYSWHIYNVQGEITGKTKVISKEKSTFYLKSPQLVSTRLAGFSGGELRGKGEGIQCQRPALDALREVAAAQEHALWCSPPRTTRLQETKDGADSMDSKALDGHAGTHARPHKAKAVATSRPLQPAIAARVARRRRRCCGLRVRWE